MIKSGLNPIQPDRRDYSFLHSFGAITPPVETLPANFSIYDGRPIPNQNASDTRFTPALPPLPYGCTGEAGSFEAGIQDGALYNPEDLYLNTPPGGSGGRDIRAMLQTLCSRGPRTAEGAYGPRRLAYFNVYGAGKIGDFDAAKIALWVNQMEKRDVIIGTWWYWGDAPQTTLPLPSFRTNEATLHCYLVTGWSTDPESKVEYLEIIPWIGQAVGDQGKFRLSKEIYDALMGQPYTGAFTVTKVPSVNPVPIGLQANFDHIVYSLNQFIRNLFSV